MTINQRDINVVLTLRQNDRGALPVGIIQNDSGTYTARCSNGTGTQVNLGVFNTVEEAFDVYKAAKKKRLVDLADQYKSEICKDVYAALCKWEFDIND